MSQITIPGPHHYEVKVDSVIIRNNFNETSIDDQFTIIIDRVAEPQDIDNHPVGPPVRLKSLYLKFGDIKNHSIPANQQLTVEQIFLMCMSYIQSRKGDEL